MIKRTLLVLISILLAGYFVIDKINTSKKNDVLQQERDQNYLEKVTAVRQLVARTNAITDWVAELSNGSSRHRVKIFTIDLEKVWISDRPILFTGSIQDIKPKDANSYTMLIERGWLTSFGPRFYADLQLSLTVQKKIMDELLLGFPDLTSGYRGNNFVVAAIIDSVETTYYSGEECGREEIKIGYGKLVDLEHVGGVRLDKADFLTETTIPSDP